MALQPIRAEFSKKGERQSDSSRPESRQPLPSGTDTPRLEEVCVCVYLSVWAPGDRFHNDGLVLLLNLKAVAFLLGVNLAQRKSTNYFHIFTADCQA